MKPFRTLALLAALVLLGALPASASAALTASRARVGGHTGFVRIVIDFTGAPLTVNQVDLAAGAIDASGNARIEIAQAGALSTAAAVNAGGVRVTIAPDATGLRVSLQATRRRFKYIGYQVLHTPERLVIDLYRRASNATLSRGGCLTVSSSTTSTAGRVVARGRVRTQLFENTFRVRLRRSNHSVISAHTVTTAHPTGPWSKILRHRVVRRQTGLVEAVVFSAKDGALQCLFQRRVTLR